MLLFNEIKHNTTHTAPVGIALGSEWRESKDGTSGTSAEDIPRTTSGKFWHNEAQSNTSVASTGSCASTVLLPHTPPATATPLLPPGVESCAPSPATHQESCVPSTTATPAGSTRKQQQRRINAKPQEQHAPHRTGRTHRCVCASTVYSLITHIHTPSTKWMIGNALVHAHITVLTSDSSASPYTHTGHGSNVCSNNMGQLHPRCVCR